MNEEKLKECLVATFGVDSNMITEDLAYNAIPELLERYAKLYNFSLGLPFLKGEWESVIKNNGLIHWEEYRDIIRTGRGKKLSIKNRKEVWDRVHNNLEEDQDAQVDESGDE